METPSNDLWGILFFKVYREQVLQLLENLSHLRIRIPSIAVYIGGAVGLVDFYNLDNDSRVLDFYRRLI